MEVIYFLAGCRKKRIPKFITYLLLRELNYETYLRSQIYICNHNSLGKIPEKYIAKYCMKFYNKTRDDKYLRAFNEFVKLRSKYVAKYTKHADLYEIYKVQPHYVHKYQNALLFKYFYNHDIRDDPVFMAREHFTCANISFLTRAYILNNYDTNLFTSTYRDYYGEFMYHCLCKRRYDLLEYYYSWNYPSAAKLKIKRKQLNDPVFLQYIFKYIRNCVPWLRYYAFKYSRPDLLKKYKCQDTYFKTSYYANKHGLTEYMIGPFNEIHISLMENRGTQLDIRLDVGGVKISNFADRIPYIAEIKYFIHKYYKPVMDYTLTEYPFDLKLNRLTYHELQI
jgi:hypothetical protein